MMLTLRQRLFIIIGISSGIVIAIILFFVFRSQNNTQEDPINTQINQNSTDANPYINPALDSILEQTDTLPISTENPEERYVRQVSSLFIERFASYSNQNDNRHISDISSLVTDKMTLWIRTQEIEQGAEYSGVSTRALSTKLTDFSGTDATVEMQVQQTISTVGIGSPEVIQKQATVQLLKIGEQWLVDAVYWK